MGVDDLLLGLTYHWARDTSIFPTERGPVSCIPLLCFIYEEIIEIIGLWRLFRPFMQEGILFLAHPYLRSII